MFIAALFIIAKTWGKNLNVYQRMDKEDGMEWNGILCSLRHVQLFATPWTVAHQARILEQVAVSFRGSSRPRDQTQVSCVGRWILYHCAIWEAPMEYYSAIKKNETMPFAAM